MTNDKAEFDIEGMAAEEERRAKPPIRPAPAVKARTEAKPAAETAVVATVPKAATLQEFGSVNMVKAVVAAEYQKQVENFFEDKKEAMRFLSSMVGAVQRTPELLKCTPISVMNSFMTMAQLKLMASGVSGEAYVLPYANGKTGQKDAQFQLGYQGLVTLFYRAGIRKIVAETVFEGDKFELVNGDIRHEVDPFAERGKYKGTYVIVTLPSGETVSKVMSEKEILDIAQKFSKSFSSEMSPWNLTRDPQRHMHRKTVLKQIAKYIPKNDAIMAAIAEDNRDSIIGDRLKPAKDMAASMRMGALLKSPDANEDAKTFDQGESHEEGVQA